MNGGIGTDMESIARSTLVDWSRFAGKTVLVTGACGMLASCMVRALLHLNSCKSYGINVLALVRSEEKARKVFGPECFGQGLQLLVQDVCEPVAIDGPVDYIIHAASPASPKYYSSIPVDVIDANVSGTTNILSLAAAKGSKAVLYFSSSEIYGSACLDKVKETEPGLVDPLSVRSCYSESKRMGEQLCAAWNLQYGIHARIVRPFHTYGPGMSLDDGRVFASFVKDAVYGRDIVLESDGSAIRSFCYVTDAVEAYFKVLLDGEDSQAYNVGNPYQTFSIRELADIILSLSGSGRKVVLPSSSDVPAISASAVSKAVPDISKIEGLGWKPRTGVREGFAKVISHFKGNEQ